MITRDWRVKLRSVKRFPVRQVFLRGLFAALLGWVCLSHGATPWLVTNVVALREIGGTDAARVVTLELTGEIWWADNVAGRVIFKDASDAVQPKGPHASKPLVEGGPREAH